MQLWKVRKGITSSQKPIQKQTVCFLPMDSEWEIAKITSKQKKNTGKY